MTVRRALVVTTGAVSYDQYPPSMTGQLGWLQAWVDGYIEVIGGIGSGGFWSAYVNEDGKLRGLPPNHVATALAHDAGWSGDDVIVGTAVFVGTARGASLTPVPDWLVALLPLDLRP